MAADLGRVRTSADCVRTQGQVGALLVGGADPAMPSLDEAGNNRAVGVDASLSGAAGVQCMSDGRHGALKIEKTEM